MVAATDSHARDAGITASAVVTLPAYLYRENSVNIEKQNEYPCRVCAEACKYTSVCMVCLSSCLCLCVRDVRRSAEHGVVARAVLASGYLAGDLNHQDG